MESPFTVIRNILIRPEMFVGSNDVVMLSHFLNGFVFGLSSKHENEGKYYRRFSFWLIARLGDPDLHGRGWCEALLQHTSADNDRALQTLRVELNKYLDEYRAGAEL